MIYIGRVIRAMQLSDHWLVAAKFGGGRGTPPYHPLFCHMADVAAVAMELWHQVLPGALRERLSRAVDLNDSGAAHWVGFIAGVHDLGKASPAFTSKDPTFARRASPAGLPVPTILAMRPPPGHGLISQLSLRDILLGHPFELPRRTAVLVAAIAGGHHGTFPTDQDIQNARKTHDSAIGNRVWAKLRLDLAVALSETLDLPRPGPNANLTSIDGAILSGLTSVADWIGSDERFFPYAEPCDEKEYFAQARSQASDALRNLGWLTAGAPASPLSLDNIIPGEPWPVQQAVADAVATTTPALIIVEAPMGEGKTEAAMLAADAANVRSRTHGTYFALPTMATSNQMFGRVAEFLRTRFPEEIVQLQLRHGHASLVSEFERIRQRGRSIPEPRYSADAEGDNLVAADWFAPSKRGLLAPFGVGTVDQLLMSVLRVKHGAVRLFGLAAKPVIIDEVHAYDTYTSTLLARTLEWLAALGAPVILLSATLPADRRRTLVDAYRSGMGHRDGIEPHGVPYPRVSVVHRDGAVEVRHVEAAARSIRDLRLERIPAGDLEQLAGLLMVRLAEGGCGAVVCNTVARAQEVYRHLRSRFPGMASDGSPIVDLLHARFTLRDRQERELAALARFGKEGREFEHAGDGRRRVRRPDKAILVATQVIEQSLDIDFDIMVSELAPVDLLLQRSGRLHRHERPRPAPSKEPTLVILEPPVRDAVPEFAESDEWVYARHVLLRTWLALMGRTHIRIPVDLEPLIEAVYADAEPPNDLPLALIEDWRASARELRTTVEEHEREATARLVKPPLPGESLSNLMRAELDEDAPDIHRAFQALTRLGPPTVDAVLLHQGVREPVLEPGGKPATFGEVTDMDMVRALVERSVSMSHAGVVHQLLEAGRPWSQTPLLRHARELVLDSAGKARVGRYTLQYDAELGLGVIKEQDQ